MSSSKRRRRNRWQWLIPVIALLAAASYPLWTASHASPGFPLDDAWIHQTYARNLAETGQLAFRPGEPSAGSTSPAWSFLLSAGYLLGVDHRLWAYLLGGLALAATAWFAYRLLARLAPSRPGATLLAGLFCAVEWHLVWAAASGMETMLFTALSLALLDSFFAQVDAAAQPDNGPLSLQRERQIVRAVGLGLLGGALTLTRPEGLGLAGLVLAGQVLLPLPQTRPEVRWRLLAGAAATVTLGVMLTPYIAFNLDTSGSIFPNTFYAKQAEYRVYLEGISLPARFWRVLRPTLVGAQVLLVPGFVYAVYRVIRRRRWPALVPVLWWLAFLSAYALRLPVDYQHGRYSIPSIPMLLIYGTWGTALLLRLRSPRPALRAVSRATPLAVAVLALLFWGRGALAYQADVGFVQEEMVATARWLNEHTDPEALIAAHDIGAVGYLTDRPLLDLAGLITPEVVPFIADAEKLADWMVSQGAAYAVFFPDFSPTYARLAADPRLEPVYCTAYEWTRSQGHQNMCIYRLITENSGQEL